MTQTTQTQITVDDGAGKSESYHVDIDLEVNKDTWVIAPILTSPDLTKYRLIVANGWALSTEAV